MSIDTVQPNVAALFSEGMQLLQAGRPSVALAILRKALGLAPDQPDLLAGLGEAYRLLHRFDEGRQSCEHALEHQSEHLPALMTLADILAEEGRVTEAEHTYRRCLVLNTEAPELHWKLGMHLFQQKRYGEAIPYLETTLHAAPQLGELAMVLGIAYLHRLRIQDAVASFDLALSLGADATLVRWNRCLANLLDGHMDDEAWEARELRWAVSGNEPRAFGQPPWDGKPLKGRTLLLHGEYEGLGDSIHGLHYAAFIRQQGGRIVVECHPSLVELVRTCPDVDMVVAQGESLPSFDCHAHLMSLPHLARTRMDTIPQDVPYLQVPLRANVRHASEIDKRMERCPGLRIGLVWAGSLRQLDPTCLEPLKILRPDVCFFSLQKHRNPTLAPLPGNLDVTDLGDLLEDFSDTAYALNKLDHLISVDTSLVHLAGAMARPCKVLLDYAPDWRWLLNRADSPWYPTLKLYRQPQAGHWTSVMDRLVTDLQAQIRCSPGRREDLA